MIGVRVTPAPGSPTRAQLDELISQVRVTDARTRPGGYERGCKAGQGCVFGPAWSDDQDAPGGHDGCDTRNNTLARQLTDVRLRAGSTCVVLSGTLNDPYTGEHIGFVKADAKAVQIDHVYPLAAAWDLGASTWPLPLRMRFANDLDFNLLAVDGKTNQHKGDSTPADWLPPARANHCYYAAKYLTVATHYDLPVTKADRKALERIARGCP
ncbi:HNH endonuclease family protein [Nocardia jejuensis]|uniref:HNH endonuclease family protein n=1 Tax=Nocardia jejuensis TaxID=328049 RepID=UPI00082BCE39|nr:HNH endonuclease family protein [Nocardia jejuensis]